MAPCWCGRPCTSENDTAWENDRVREVLFVTPALSGSERFEAQERFAGHRWFLTAFGLWSSRTTPEPGEFGVYFRSRNGRVSSADALQARIRALCASGRAELVQEVPPDAWRCKTLVVSTQALEGAEKDAGAQTAVLVVLRLEQRLSLPKLKPGQLLKPQRLKILGLASPREAEDVIGCSMGATAGKGGGWSVESPEGGSTEWIACSSEGSTERMDVRTSPAAGPRLVLGAADEEMHLAMSPRELLLETEACIAEISDSGPDTALPEFPLRAGRGNTAAQRITLNNNFFQVTVSNVVHVVALVAAVRRLSRQLLFADLLPAGSPKDGERSVWLSPDGSGKLVRLQLLLGRSLAERLGGDGLSAVVKRLRPMQLVYVAGRLQLEEPGEQCGKATPAAPTEVRKIREAQLSNGIVDMAEQIRILEEVHLPSELSGSARQVGVKKELPPTAHAPDSGLPTLPLALPQRAVHVVTDLQGVELLENVLRERLSGSGDVDPHDGMASKESTVFTPLLPVMGVDAEWQPRTSHGLALFQMAFRRSVFLLDMVALTRQDPLRGRVAELIKEALEAEHLYKVGFNLEVDLQRLHAVLPETSCAVNLIDLRDLHAVALPNAPSKPLSLTGMVKEVFGLPLDKTCQVSDWQKRPLTPEQLDYAAQDAHVCVRLFDSLCYNHATVATQVLQPVLRGMVRTWPREKEPAIVRTADRRATEWDSVQQGAQLQLVPKEGKGAGRNGKGKSKGRQWRPSAEVAQRHVGHWRFLAKAEGDFRIVLSDRGTLLFQLGPAEGTLLPQEKRWLQCELRGPDGEAAGAARVRFSEKSESMMYAFSSEDVFGDATAAYRVLTPREAEQVSCEEAISLSNKAARLLERGLASWEPQGYIYMKKRKDFGRYCNFDTVEAKILGQVEKQPSCGDMYVEQTIINAATWFWCGAALAKSEQRTDIVFMTVFHNIPEFSEHSVNTARVKTHARVMTHVEGGWPKEIDYSEAQDTLKYRKRLEKERSSPLLPDSTRSTAGRDPAYISAVRQLTKQTIPCLEMNNTIDLFEIYFQDEEPDHMPEILNLKTIALFKDPSDEARSVTKIGWHPEGPTKLVGSYSNLRFQRMSEDMPMASFIWDISERNVPLMELRATSPLICCQYNQKNPDWLLGGSYSGLINHYDLRKGPSPCMKSSVEVGHYDPVYDVVWLQSKTGTECASVSSDGRLLFWDVRKLNEVSDECVLTDGNKESPKTLGGVSLEWMQEAGPTKFLVGSEHGIILSCTKRPKKQVEIGTWFGSEDRGGYGKHFGPVYSVKRNPFHVKFFLSVGDWCGKMWMEELKGPMLQTPYYPAFISAAAWSPTRAGVPWSGSWVQLDLRAIEVRSTKSSCWDGFELAKVQYFWVFFLARQDGRLDVWDYFYRMNEVALTQQVSDRALTSLNVQSHGRLAAVGDAGGVITLLQLCDGLVEPGPNEKNAIGWMFDRETKREKALDQIKKQGGGPKKDDKEGATGTSIDKTKYQEREKAFFTEPLGGS
ncbi:70 kDa intermediate chain [Durusdinium trenchii]|uniref:70 kDa intermediate chain n=1 Tax=Durusdinium trenchii TaxID=1381693 RepID=A0ABP0PJC3_9DINO